MSRLPARIDAEPETVGRDLGRLVLTIVELLRQLMERQAIRRVEAGYLPEETVERLGLGPCIWRRRWTSSESTSGYGPKT